MCLCRRGLCADPCVLYDVDSPQFMKTKPMKKKTIKTIKKKNRVVEMMFRRELKNFVVRHWIDIDFLDYVQLGAVLDDHDDDIPGSLSLSDIAEDVAALPGITAVEVLDRDGNGVVVYPDWH